MRVLLDAATAVPAPTGLGMYAWELAAALTRRGDVDVLFASPYPGPEGTTHYPPPPSHRQMWRQLILPGRMKREGIDLYHGTEYTAPVRGPVPRVAMIHDLFADRMPGLWPMRPRFHHRAITRAGIRADRVIVPASWVAADLVRMFGVPRERIRVIAEAQHSSMRPAADAEVEDVRRAIGISGPYLLCVGIGHRAKRTVDAIRALALLRDDAARFHLVLTGGAQTQLAVALRREVAKLGLDDRVHFTGYFEGDLRALYSGAVALVYPSLMEGFGIPPLEAMACGTPVITTEAPAMDEVLKGAAMFVPVRSPEAIARKVRELLESKVCREEWRGRGLEHARRFSWDRAAAETVEVYRELVTRDT